jgi:hypothetical protein
MYVFECAWSQVELHDRRANIVCTTTNIAREAAQNEDWMRGTARNGECSGAMHRRLEILWPIAPVHSPHDHFAHLARWSDIRLLPLLAAKALLGQRLGAASEPVKQIRKLEFASSVCLDEMNFITNRIYRLRLCIF